MLTRSEVISGARAIRKTRDEAAELFDKLDINGDGVLDLDEFGAGVKGPPDMAMHDGNMIVLHSEPTVAYNRWAARRARAHTHTYANAS